MKKCGILALTLILFLTGGCTSNKETQKEEKIVLTVLAGQSTSDAGVEDMIDEWVSKEYPDVMLEWECVDWGERFASQMQGRLAAGDVPDIIIGKAQDVKSYAGTGKLGEISKECREKIKDEALEAVTVNGKAYGVPYNAWYQGVIYNKDIFERLGLALPTTPEEMDQVIAVLKENNIVPFAAHFQESWKVANMTMQYMMNDIFNDDPTWGDKFRAGEVSFSGNEKIISCMMNNKKILDASWDDAIQLDQFESDSRFTQGEAAMYLTGSWSMQFANQYGKDVNFGIFPFPNQSGTARLIRETNMTFMKSTTTEHGDLIDRIFFAMLQDKALAQEILDFTQSASVIKGVSSEYRSKIQDDIDRYEQQGQVIDAATGNAQLVWEFQESTAGQQLSWLKREKTMEEVLAYADENRAHSSYREMEER